MKNGILKKSIVIMLLVFLCMGCGKADDKQKNVTEMAIPDSPVGPAVNFTMAELNSEDTIVGKMDREFVEKVAEYSGGAITIDLRCNGEMGSEQDIMEGMMNGSDAVDITRVSAFFMTNYGGEKSKLISLPYTFRDREHFWKFAESDLAKEFLNEVQEKGMGIKGLFFAEEGFRHFFSLKELNSIEDIKGLSVRVSNDPIMSDLVEYLGAEPVVLDFSKVSSSLKNGSIDAAEQPVIDYEMNGFYEHAGNMILDGHTLGAVQVVMSESAWESLTEAQQDVIMAASHQAKEYCRKLSMEEEEQSLDRLKKKGVRVVHVADKSEWKAAMKELIKRNTEGLSDLYEQITELGE